MAKHRRVKLIALLLTVVIAAVSAQTYTFEDELTPTPTPLVSSEMPALDAESFDSDDDEDASSGLLAWGLLEMTSYANISTLESTHTDWVGPGRSTAMDMTCYRETHVAEVCPLGFESKLGTCWAECPLAYPVECGSLCIRQNDDCTLEMLSKVSAVAQSALSVATFGVYGAFSKMAKVVQTAYQCGKEIANLVKSLTRYMRNVKVTDPQTTTDRLMAMLYQTNNVVYDLPITIMSCLGVRVSEGAKVADRVTNTVELVVKEVVTKKDAITSSWESFTAFLKIITLGDTVDSLNETDISSLRSALESNSTCGDDMKRLTDRVWLTVANLRKENPSISEDEMRVVMMKSNLMHHDIPTATNNCMIEESDEVTAYSTRDTLRKTFGGIVDDLIRSGSSDNGTFLSAEEYAYSIADKALMFTAVWDVTNIAGVASEFFQSICSPTEFIGEVDDGSASDALGLTTVGEAFSNSTGVWAKNGDGTVTLTLRSEDTEDVTVNIMSGGNEVDSVDVEPGASVTCISNMTALGGKTLYLDRWRAGFLGIPGTGGGSLLLWIPRSTQGGKLELTAMLNVS